MNPTVVYVDVSAKVEQSQASAVAAANGICVVILVPTSVKRQGIALLRSVYGAEHAHYRLFAALVYLTVRGSLPEIGQIVIDLDYSGRRAEETIKNVLLRFLRRDRRELTAGFVRFASVKGTRADSQARRVFQGKEEPDYVLTWEILEAVLRK